MILENSRLIPLKGDEKTFIQRLRAYIDPVDKEWFCRLQPASEMQIAKLKQQLDLDKAGIELPLVYIEFLHYAGESAGGLFFPSLLAEMSISSLISWKEKLHVNGGDSRAPYCFTFLMDNIGICYTMNLSEQNQKIFLEEDYPVSENFENFVFQSAVKCYEEKYYTRMMGFSSSINNFNNSEVGKKNIDLFEFTDGILETYNLEKAWFNDDYFYFACSNELSIILDRSGGALRGKIFFNEIHIGKDIEKILLSKIGANIYKK